MRSLNLKIIETKTALSKSRIPGIDYTINPYFGCEFGCSYCYADFMSKFSKNYKFFSENANWGEFVGVKINIAEKLKSEILKLESKTSFFQNRNKPSIWLSIVTDPYQPVEKKFKLTRKCLEILLEFQYPVGILTRSPLVLRDVDLLTQFDSIEVGFSITTDNDRIRKIFEPKAPSIISRVKALEKLKSSGVKTFAFIGPILPMDAKNLAREIIGLVDYVLVDKMNYIWKTEKIYRINRLDFAIGEDYFKAVAEEIYSEFSSKGIEVQILF